MKEQSTHFRRGERRPVALRIRFRTGAQLTHEGSTVDMGMGGAFIDARHLPSVGQTVVLLLRSPTAWDELSLECRVRWVKDDGAGRGFGVRFEGLTAGESSALYELLHAAEFLSEKDTP